MERKHKPCPRTPGVVLTEGGIIRKRLAKSERKLKRPNPSEVVIALMEQRFRLVNRLEEMGENINEA